ncbi:MAG: Oligopeptide-binding protein AppA precursor [bacterium ADurb.Bin270]|nr:MAG: Oligopeptide-binding protein AppA precursor [bacterium ADurb.Bin270]
MIFCGKYQTNPELIPFRKPGGFFSSSNDLIGDHVKTASRDLTDRITAAAGGLKNAGMMRPLSLRFGLLVCLISMILSFSCSRSAETDFTLRVGIPNGPVTLDTRLATDSYGIMISRLIGDGLFKLTPNFEVVPNLVESYEQPSETIYIFRIREGVKFHNGLPLTAEDVEYTYKSILGSELNSPFKGAFDRVKAMEVLSPTSIRIELKEPYAPFLTVLGIGIVPKKIASEMGEGFGTAPVGTGPYKLIRFVSDSIVELEANAEYYGEIPKTRKLTFDVIKDDNVRILKLMKGEIDLVQNGIPPMLIDKILEDPAIKMKSDTSVVVTYLGFNLSDPILKNGLVRGAIAHAIDRDAIIGHRFKGLAVKANSILAPENWAYNSELRGYDFDPSQAKRMLDEAGFPDPDGDGPGKRFVIVYKTSTVKERIDIAQMIAHQLGDVGIGVRVEPYEWGKFYGDIRKGNFQMYSLSWSLLTEPDMFYDICHTSQLAPKGVNRNRYSDPEVDDLVLLGRVTMDRARRKEIYARVQQILLQDLPYLPLWYEKNVVLYRDNLIGVTLRPDGDLHTLVGVEKKKR